MQPLISVITPCFNGAATIEQCIESIASQNYQNIEHIVIDGGSTDGTLDILMKKGVRYISEPDAGIYDAMNKGIRLAKGEIVGILNCDDYYCSQDALGTVLKAFEDPEVSACHGRIAQVFANGKIACLVGRNVSFEALRRKMKVAHPALFLRRSVYERYGDYSVGFRIAADHDFVLRIWNRVNINYIADVLIHMRMEGVSHKHFARSLRESSAAAVLHGRHPLLAYKDYLTSLFSHYVVLAWRRK